MLFDSTMLARVTADLGREAIGARIARVFQTARDEVVLELRRKLPRPQIVLSCAADFGRAHLAAEAEPRPDVQFPFGDVLRKHLRGAMLVAAQQAQFDRLLRLEFANCVGLGPQSRATLVAEIMGRHGNLILLDEDETIIACVKHVSASVNRYRETLPHLQYTPPPAFERLDPHDLTPCLLRERSEAHSDASVRDCLRKTLMGAGDVFLDELCARAKLDGARFVDELPGGWEDALVAAAADILGEAEEDGPGFIYTRSGPGRGGPFAYPLVLQSHLDLECERSDDLSAALETVALSLRTSLQLTQGRERLAGFARRAVKRAVGREAKRRRALGEAEDADELRRRGELILANLHAIPEGAAEATVTDYYQPEQPEVTLRLDANYSPQQNAEALFKRYKRARRIQDRVPRLLRAAQIEREYLEGALHQIENADSLQDLHELEHELHRRGYIGQQAGRKRRPPPRGEVKLKRITSADGHAIIYGKTGAQNDDLIREADGDDFWFHVKDGPGGHVLIRTGGKPEDISEATILEAAGIAAGLSRWRTDARADVNYTLMKHVRKPKGAPPGFVTYRDFKTVTVEPRVVV